MKNERKMMLRTWLKGKITFFIDGLMVKYMEHFEKRFDAVENKIQSEIEVIQTKIDLIISLLQDGNISDEVLQQKQKILSILAAGPTNRRDLYKKLRIKAKELDSILTPLIEDESVVATKEGRTTYLELPNS